MIALDTLYPPDPAQLVMDCRQVSAGACAVYVFRPGGAGNWTPLHVVYLRGAGIRCWPIAVPHAAGDDPQIIIEAARRFGFVGGCLSLDLEPPNLPPASWEEHFDSYAAAAGYHDLDYCTAADCGRYQPDSPTWLASWLRTGVLDPVPQLLAGHDAWQFVNGLRINGSTYDASVIDPAVFGGPRPAALLPDEMPRHAR